jgi:drug/metabolite transporter (DMT)-like permease
MAIKRMISQHKHMLLAMILLGMSLIPVGDAAGKLLTEMDISPVFVAWSRLLVGFLFILPFSGLVRAEIKLL